MKETCCATPAPGLGKGPINYHTHTFRCRHALGQDIEYVDRAVAEGFTAMGFSDHTPFPEPFRTKGRVRMLESEFPDYVQSLTALREQYSGRIDIHIGLEVEPFFQYLDWIRDLTQENGIEYLILGNHYGGQTEFDGYYGKIVCDAKKLRYYVETTEKAMDTGLFMYMAHPDLPFSNYPVWDKECERLSIDICTMAQEKGMPLEYNVSGYQKRIDGKLWGLGYPNDNFWDIAQDYNLDVFIGLDAHLPKRIDKRLFDESTAKLRAKGFKVLNG